MYQILKRQNNEDSNHQQIINYIYISLLYFEIHKVSTHNTFFITLSIFKIIV